MKDTCEGRSWVMDVMRSSVSRNSCKYVVVIPENQKCDS